jgi:transcriptional regulator with XRE-family HTH domain
VETFAQWFAERARAAGYDVDSPRGGGRAALADAAGVSRGQVSRTLSGDTVPDIRSQRLLAKALGLPFRDMLIRSGYMTEEDFPPAGEESAEATVAGLQSIIADWGIPEDRVDLFLSAVESLAKVFVEDAADGAEPRSDRKIKGPTGE